MRYPKINSVFLRDDKGKFQMGEWSTPEFGYLANLPWVGYEKYDGTNTRIYSDGVKGRTDNSQWNDEVLAAMNLVWGAAMDADVFAEGGIKTLYGEAIGPKVQGNPHGLDNHEFILFDGLLASGRWLEDHELEIIADKIDVHQAVNVSEWRSARLKAMDQSRSLTDWIAFVGGGSYNSQGYLFPQHPCEGFILRPEVPLLDMYGHRIQTKLKFKDFQ